MRHWVMLMPANDKQDAMADAYRASPDIFGIMKKYPWCELVLGSGGTMRFRLDELRSDAQWCKQRGLRFSPMITDKSFNGVDAVPACIRSQQAQNTTGGFTAFRWKSQVIDLMCETYRQVIAALSADDTLLALHGFAIQESALGLDRAILVAQDYSPDSYANSILATVAALDNMYSGRPTYWHGNFFRGNQKKIDDIIRAGSGHGNFRYGSPDCWPTAKSLIDSVFPRFEVAHNAAVPTFIGVSRESYMQWLPDEERWMTMQEVMDFAARELYCEELLWSFIRARPRPGANNFTDAAKLM